MWTVSSSDFEENPASWLDKIETDEDQLIIERPDRPPLTLVTLRELEAWGETVHLLGNPANATRLLRSIGELNGAACNLVD